MKKKVLAIMIAVICFILATTTGCSEPTYGISFDREEIDFGEISQGSNVELAYEFTNIGTGQLVIEDVIPQCGCTVPRSWDVSVAPGKRGTIPVTYESVRELGTVMRAIEVRTNVPGRETVTLSLTGNVAKVLLDVAPRNIFLAEVNSKTRELHGVFGIANNTRRPLAITRVVSPSDIATEYSITEVVKGERFRFNFIVRAPFPGKERVQKQFTLETDDPSRPVIELYFGYRVLPVFEVFPNVLRIDPDEVERAGVRANIYVRSNEQLPIVIRDLIVKNGRGISLATEAVTVNESHKIIVTVPKGFRVGARPDAVISFRLEGDPESKLYSAIVGPVDPSKK